MNSAADGKTTSASIDKPHRRDRHPIQRAASEPTCLANVVVSQAVATKHVGQSPARTL